MSSAPVLERSDRDAGPTDHQLVTAVRRGDDHAFETLYSRYQRRIAAYTYGMVKDYGRAEDITQEIFISALRRMRQTERPIAFKPWIYEIAKNACIDAYRRQRRAEEVSFEAHDHLSSADHGRLVATAPEPEAAVDAKEELDLLCGAFGGLTESHHQVLVMREFEGLSYQDIGERMGMSRPAVESTLFRARKRLGEEYDELASGARCLRIQSIIVEAGEASLGLRDQRRLSRHVSHCQPCRRLAFQSGVEIPVPARTRAARRIAAWLPLPAILRLRRGGDEVAPSATGGGGGGSWLAHAPALSDAMSSGWGKAAAGLAALLVAGAGAGVTTTLSGDKRDERGTGYRPAAERTIDRDGAGGAAARTPASAARERAGSDARAGRRSVGTARRQGGERGGPGGAAVGGGDAGTAPRRVAPAADAGGSPGGSGGGGGGGDSAQPGSGALRQVPQVKTPAVNVPAADPVQEAVDDVGQTVENAGQNVQQTVDQTLQNANQVVTDPANVVPNVTKTAGDAVQGAGTTVGGAVDDVSQTVGGLLGP